MNTMDRRWWLVFGALAAIPGILSISFYLNSSFYYFSSYPGPTALVSADVVSCSGNPEVCALRLQNTGSADAATTSTCSLTFGGTTHAAKSTLATIKVGKSVTVTCTASGGTTPPGSQISGSIIISSGAEVDFSGTSPLRNVRPVS